MKTTMTERQMLQELTKQIKALDICYWYKIGDTFGGHKKPADVFAVYNKRPFMLEFKNQNSKLSDNQKEELTKAYNNGIYTFLCVFDKHRNIECRPVIKGVIQKHFFILTWYKGEYVFLNSWFRDLQESFIIKRPPAK